MIESGIRIKNVSKSFAGLRAVQGISIEAPGGAICAVIGPNGAGKTTLFNCVTGVLKADAGSCTVFRDGRASETLGCSPEDLCRIGVARTFQHPRLFDSLSAVDNVMLGVLVRHPMGLPAAGLDRLVGRSHKHRQLRDLAQAQLSRLNLTQKCTELAGNLDHGSRRRLEIARAIATDPCVLLLDEPAAGMNHSETETLMELFVEFKRSGMSVLLIEHDMRMVMGISDTIYVVDHGEHLATGRPAEVSQNPAVIEAYLGGSGRAHAAS
jgi:branched-chain amino acid transport system ATP-binding protein